MRDTFVKKLNQLAANDDRIHLVTADLGFGIFNEFSERFPKQYLNVGVAEQLMISVASGMALEGAKVITYSIANFATFRCLEQIRNDAAYHDLNITVVSSGGGFTYGQLGMSHHATEDLAVMRAIPGIDVCAPASVDETDLILDACVKKNNVSYLRLEKSAIKNNPMDSVKLQYGSLTKYSDGDCATIISIGGITAEAIAAAEMLKQKGLNVSVFGCHTLKPFDTTGVLQAVSDSRLLITLEEHSRIGGLASAVSETCLKHGVYPRKFCSFGLEDRFSSVVGDQNFLRNYYKIGANSLVEYIINNI